MEFIDFEQRKQIEKMLSLNRNAREISEYIRKSIETVRGEIASGTLNGKYSANYSEELSRRSRSLRNLKGNLSLSDSEKEKIAELFNKQVPIYQIASILRRGKRKITAFLEENNLTRKKPMPKLGVNDRLLALEEQINLIHEILQEIRNDKTNN